MKVHTSSFRQEAVPWPPSLEEEVCVAWEQEGVVELCGQEAEGELSREEEEH